MSETHRDRNIESAICYTPILSILIAPVVFLVEAEDKFVRFHAVQGFLLACFYYLLIFMLGSLPFVGNFVSVGIFLLFLVPWLYGIVNSYSGHVFKFPVLGNIAERKVK